MTQIITADPKLTFLKAVFTAEYRVDIAFFDRGGIRSTQECAVKAQTLGPKPIEAGSGAVFVNSRCLDGTGYIWASAGPLPVAGGPIRRLCFPRMDIRCHSAGCGSGLRIEVRGPMLINPRFEPAKRVRLYTNPVGLRLRMDSTEVLTVDPERLWCFIPFRAISIGSAGSRHDRWHVSSIRYRESHLGIQELEQRWRPER